MKYIVLFYILLFSVFLNGCLSADNSGSAEITHENGTYRGNFFDRDNMEVGIQFTLEDNVVINFTYRHLHYSGTDYLRDQSTRAATVRTQWQELSVYLTGKDIRLALNDLYSPGSVIETEAEGLTGASIRSGKLISSVRDALNRGVYSR